MEKFQTFNEPRLSVTDFSGQSLQCASTAREANLWTYRLPSTQINIQYVIFQAKMKQSKGPFECSGKNRQDPSLHLQSWDTVSVEPPSEVASDVSSTPSSALDSSQPASRCCAATSGGTRLRLRRPFVAVTALTSLGCATVDQGGARECPFADGGRARATPGAKPQPRLRVSVGGGRRARAPYAANVPQVVDPL
eukprot:scaffold478_cov409-Prasinococcus_capsulatus_cf.AAC.7